MARSVEEKYLKKQQKRRKRFSKKVQGPGKEKLESGARGSFALGKQEQGSAQELAKRAAETKKGKSKTRVFTIGKVTPAERGQEEHKVVRPPGAAGVEVYKQKKPGQKAELIGTFERGEDAPKSLEGVDVTRAKKSAAEQKEEGDVLKTKARQAAVSLKDKKSLEAYAKAKGISENEADKLTVIRRKATKGGGMKKRTVVKKFGPKATEKTKTKEGAGTLKDPTKVTKVKGRKVITVEKYTIPKKEKVKKRKAGKDFRKVIAKKRKKTLKELAKKRKAA